MKLTVSRLEAYPAEEPTGRAVGFVCECDNGRSFYVDTVVSFDDGASDEDAVTKALESLGENILAQRAALEAKSALVGSDVSDQLVEPVVDDVVDDVVEPVVDES